MGRGRVARITGVDRANEGVGRLVVESRLPKLGTVSYTHLRAHETVLDLVCRLLLEKKKNNKLHIANYTLLQ